MGVLKSRSGYVARAHSNRARVIRCCMPPFHKESQNVEIKIDKIICGRSQTLGLFHLRGINPFCCGKKNFHLYIFFSEMLCYLFCTYGNGIICIVTLFTLLTLQCYIVHTVKTALLQLFELLTL